MPTGYTAKLMEEGEAFPDFVMKCARAMGATVMMRDEPLDASIPTFEPSSYYEDKIKECQSQVEHLKAMSEDEKKAFGEREKAKSIASLQERLEQDEKENARLFEMESEVRSWNPPTPDHENLKRFMLDQLRISENHLDYYHTTIENLRKKPALQVYAESVGEAERGLGYYKDADEKELLRTRGRNEWVEALRESLNLSPSSSV